MSRLSGEMLRDIEKETVAFRPNYDNTKKEPTVLPARFPNLLVRGAGGGTDQQGTEEDNVKFKHGFSITEGRVGRYPL